jgi:hypothetical protein
MHLELQDARNLVVLAIRHLELWTLVTPVWWCQIRHPVV